MASSFDALPPEIVQKCVEFLDFDLVSGDLRFHVRYGHTSGYTNEMEMYFGGAALWSANWKDRTKAGAFMAEMGRIWQASWSDPDE